MSRVPCEQLRYTWAEHRLDGTGPGFGVVARSPGWPGELAEDPGVRELLTGLSLRARGLPAEPATTFLSHRRVGPGSLLVARRPVGTDGAGRPGNYAVHALLDRSGVLGALDLVPLLAGGAFTPVRDVAAPPDPAAPLVEVSASRSWPARTGSGRGAGSSAPRLPGPGLVLPHWDAEDLAELLAQLCEELPADLVNAFEVEGGVDPTDAGEDAAAAGPPVPDLFAAVARLGARGEAFWWRRRGKTAEAWEAELRRWWVRAAPVAELADDQLWPRWDDADVAGREAVAAELLRRPDLVTDAAATAAVARRPALVDDLTEAGVRAGGGHTVAAARWVAAVGTDDQVVDLAAEVVSAAGAPALPGTLLDRLAERYPDELPAVLVDAVADRLDADTLGAASEHAASWRVAVVRRLLQGHGDAGRAVGVAAHSRVEELVTALRVELADGADLDDCWDRLGEAVPASRRAAVFAATSASSAAHLLSRGVPPGRASVAALTAVWPTLAATAGWSPAVRDVFAEVARRERALRLQRTMLLAAVGLLVAAVVVLVVLLGRAPG